MNSDYGISDSSDSTRWDLSVSGGSDQEMEVSFEQVSVDELASGGEVNTKLSDSRGTEQSKAAEVANKVGNFFKKGAGALLLGMASVKGSESLAETGKGLKGKEYQVGDGLRAKTSRLEAEANKLENAGNKLYFDGEVGSKKESAGRKMRAKAKELRHEVKVLKQDARTKVSEDVEGPSLAKERMKAALGKFCRGLGDKLYDIGNKIGGKKFDGSKTEMATINLEFGGKAKRLEAKLKVREAKIDKKHKAGLKYINSLQISKQSKKELKDQLDSDVFAFKQSHLRDYNQYLRQSGGNSEESIPKPKLEFDAKAMVDDKVYTSESQDHLEASANRIVDKASSKGEITGGEYHKLKNDIKYVMDEFRANYPNEKPQIDAEALCKHIEKYHLDDLVEVMAGKKSISVAFPKLENT